MAKKNERPIVFKKIIQGGHAHHGGAWKVAYADFVTAMMAFFLLLWILASASEDQKKSIADYFTPTLNPTGGDGGDGPLDGSTIGPDGTLTSSNSPMSTVAIPDFGKQNPIDAEQGEGSGLSGELEAKSVAASEEAIELADAIQEELNKRDEQAFEDLEKQIYQAMQAAPDLRPLIPNVIFEKTDGGLKISIIDQDGKSMFSSGSAAVTGDTRKLLTLLGSVIATLPNDIIVSGHTDANPYGSKELQTGYGNWELSSDRANAVRRVFVEAGFNLDRVTRVEGLADSDPLKPEVPKDAANRRISVVLEYMKAPSAESIESSITKADDSAPTPQNKEGAPRVIVKPRAIPKTLSIDDIRKSAQGSD
jgi:chemotaxis protein MotB